MPGPDVQDIAFAADGAVFIASEQGVFRVTDNRLQRVDAAPHPARALLARADGLWVGGVGEVVRIADGKARSLPLPRSMRAAAVPDRKSVVSGKGVSVRVDLGGRRYF